MSCILTSASLHNWRHCRRRTYQPGRSTSLYDLIDHACDAARIRACQEKFGHVPVVDLIPAAHVRAGARDRDPVRRAANRLQEHSTAERVNGHLKDEFGGRRVHVSGHVKVITHRMCGIWVLSVDQLIRLPD